MVNKSLMAEIKEDPTYVTFSKMVDNAKRRVNVEQLMEEVLGLHASRTSPNMHGEKRYSPKAMLEANERDLAARSRLVKIRITSDQRLSIVREAVSAMRKHVLTKYNDEMKDCGYVTANSKKAFADRVIKGAMAYMAQGETLLKNIDLLIGDLDSAGFALNRMGNLVQMLSEGKGRTL